MFMGKTTNTVKEVKEKVEKITFSKAKILRFERYKNRVDLLNVLLDDKKPYTTDEVDSLVEKFMKGKVN